ncbi:MAG: murein biosynthesis integral membrane protein MurJ [Patescibacteria group bacterium]
MSALSTAFIPLYAKIKARSENESSLFASQVLNGIFLVFLGVGVLAFLFAPLFVPLIAPGLNAESLELAVNLSRLMLLSPLFLGISSVLQGVENVERRFWGMALAPLVYNLSIILAAYFFAPQFGVYALAVGVIVGAFLHFLVQVPGILLSSFTYRFRLPRFTKEMREFIRLSLPRIFGMSAVQIGLLVDTILASLISVGALSVYMYALNLESFPYGVVAISFSVAVFSTLAEKALSKDRKEFVATVRASLETILFWAVPATVGLFLVREPVISLILRGGAFDESAFLLTLSSFSILVWAALPQSLIPLLVRSFYALSETKIPVALSFLTVFVNIGLSLLFTQVLSLGVPGLALSNLISSSISAFLLLIFLARFSQAKFFQLIPLRESFSIFFSAGLMALAVFGLSRFTFPNLLLELLALGSAGLFVYLGMSRVLYKCSQQ